ncbi:hypothetical protein S245_036859, partial [Arachis hypogaea]
PIGVPSPESLIVREEGKSNKIEPAFPNLFSTSTSHHAIPKIPISQTLISIPKYPDRSNSMANPSSSSSSSSQFTYSSDPSYFPTPFHLQQPPYAPPPRPPPPTVAATPAAAAYSYPPPPSLHHQFQRDAQQLFQRDAQTITPEALESVKAAIASSDVDHKTDAKRKAVPRRAAGQTWEDPSLAEWPENDHRLFCGDLGNEVNDDVLSKAFTRFPSFNMARVVRDKRSGKTKGYGFVSFADPSDLAVALKEMNGKYVGNRPIKLCKSKWKERTDYDAVDKQKKHSKKKLKSSSKVGVLHY